MSRTGPDLPNNRLSQFRPSVRFAISKPTLSLGVLAIILGCSKEKMVRANASRVVAAMQHEKARRDRPTCQHPSQAMCSDVPSLSSTRNPESSISVAICTASPIPAAISFQNLLPKPNFYIARWREVGYLGFSHGASFSLRSGVARSRSPHPRTSASSCVPQP